MSDLVTILIPCFNAAKYLTQALQSIVEQTHHNLIVLILDDGSSDNSLAIAQQFSVIDNRIIIHRNTKNLGIIACRNKLLDLCETEYAAWMDADDVASPLRIQKQLEFMHNHNQHVACTCFYTRTGKGTDKVVTLPESFVSREYLLFYNHVLNPGSMFRTSVSKKYDIKFRTWISGASDFQFWVELAQFGSIGIVPENLMTYRLHADQETHAQKNRQTNGCLEIVQAQFKQIGVMADIQDIARLLIYPAETLDMEFLLIHMKRSASIIQSILTELPHTSYDATLVEQLLFEMFRRQAWRNGVVGVFYFIDFFGLSGLRRCNRYGIDLLKQAIDTDFARLTKLIWAE